MPRTNLKESNSVETHRYNSVMPSELFDELEAIAEWGGQSSLSLIRSFLKLKKKIDETRLAEAAAGRATDVRVGTQVILLEGLMSQYQEPEETRKIIEMPEAEFQLYDTLAKSQGLTVALYIRLAAALGVTIVTQAVEQGLYDGARHPALPIQVGEKQFLGILG